MDVPLAEDREFAMLDQAQISTLNAVERMGATLSLVGIFLVFLTFSIFKRLRTIPNTFIFFASIANIGACVACLIAYDGISAMSQDRSAPLCQAQGFIFEWFMQSDPWWSFAMAINVYMVFFMQFNLSAFRRYIWLYCLICYGLPAIPAFVFLFLRSPRGMIYGDAVLWCWISSEWNVLRIYSYYLPIWVCSVLSAVIYVAVGYHVFHMRNQLRNLSLSNQGKDATYDSTDVRDSAEKNLTSHPGPGYYGTVTTEVQVTSAAMPAKPLPAYTNPFRDSPSRQTDMSARRSSDNLDPRATTSALVVDDMLHDSPSAPTTTTTTLLPLAPNAPGAMAPIHAHNYPWSRKPSVFSPTEADAAATPGLGSSTPFNFSTGAAAPGTASGQASNSFETTSHGFETTSHGFETTSHGFNTAQYTSISAGSPAQKDDRGPSPTRLLSPLSKRSIIGIGAENKKKKTHGEATDDDDNDHTSGKRRKSSHALRRYTKSVRHTRHPPPTSNNIFRRMSDGTRRFGAKLKHMDPVKLAYLRTSFVFAISVLVTWTPSSINRVYTLIYPEKASYGLNIAAAVVLPLQGVWNAVIYFTTSWKIFCEEMEGTRAGRWVFRFVRRHTPAWLARRSRRLANHHHGGNTNGTISGGGGSLVDGGGARRQSSGGGGGGSSSAPRSEMGRNRRLHDMDVDGLMVDGDEMEMQSPRSSPQVSPAAQQQQRRTRPARPMRTSTMRVTQKQFDDFS